MSVREIAKMALFSLLTAAIDRQAKHERTIECLVVIDEFQRIPDTGDRIDIGAWRFEVVDLDGRRIDKVLASRLP